MVVLRLRNTVLDGVGEFDLGDGGYLDGLDGHDLVLVQRQGVPDVHLRLHVHPELRRCAEQAPQAKAHLRAQVPLLVHDVVANRLECHAFREASLARGPQRRR